MRPRIAIPVPHSGDPEYAARALPQAVTFAGGEPVSIPLDESSPPVMKLVEDCHAILLPGSKADVDPAKYRSPRHPETAPADLKRDRVDELLLQDAYGKGKPVLGICYGLQILNVHRGGTLLQHIESRVNHQAGRSVPVAHSVDIMPESRLAEIFKQKPPSLVVPVNSSHHQSAELMGSDLRIVARCPEDGIVEAVEGTSSDHFVVAVQWHPERSMNDQYSRAIFRAFVQAARAHAGLAIGSRKEVETS
jgi:putative glutamine amidotransferase